MNTFSQETNLLSKVLPFQLTISDFCGIKLSF